MLVGVLSKGVPVPTTRRSSWVRRKVSTLGIHDGTSASQ